MRWLVVGGGRVAALALVLFCLMGFGVRPAAAALGEVQSETKISDSQGGFGGGIDEGDLFGWSVAALGDLDGNGVLDMVVGAPLDDDGDGPDKGAIWILWLRRDGRARGFVKISESAGNFRGSLDPFDQFGTSVAAIGDLDGDGVTELAVGAPFDDDKNVDSGAVWILFLDNTGLVKRHQKISATEGRFKGNLSAGDQFGASIAPLGDLDGDGVVDIAVGAPFDDSGSGSDQGAVWILFLQRDGNVKDYREIAEGKSGFGGGLTGADAFGTSVANLGDVDRDGVVDLAVGAPLDDDGSGADTGAVWILFLDLDGRVRDKTKISRKSGRFAGNIGPGDNFGWSVAGVGDVDADGKIDLVVGAPFDDGFTLDRGAVWVLLLAEDGTVEAYRRITQSAGNFGGTLLEGDAFGTAVCALGDLDGDGVGDLAVGAPLDNDGTGFNSGAVWLLYLQGVPATCGDANADGRIGSIDALATLRASVLLDDCELCRCDLDNSGDITASDALRVLSLAIDIPVERRCPLCEQPLPPEQP